MYANHNREFRVYKPKGKAEGTALKVQYRIKIKEEKYKEPMVFMEIARQTGVDENKNAKFDWASQEHLDRKNVTMKIGIPDAAELIQVLTGKKNQVGPPPKAGQKVGAGLFHQNKNGNTIMKFGTMAQYAGYSMQISTSKENSFRISLTEGEGVVLRLLLERFIILYYCWEP